MPLNYGCCARSATRVRLTPERWKEIDELVQAALERAPEDRAAFLDIACRGDEALRREVESLLSLQTDASSFLERPAFEDVTEMIVDEQQRSLIGSMLGHYRIVSLLGAGGMGEVYLAEDANLERKVAIKFLASDSLADSQANRRLIREARAAAKLDHPNICAIHEVGEKEGRAFIVMQYLEGDTLASRTAHKPMEVGEALEVAIEVVDAISEAHSRGIIHRDIKPQNIMLTLKGRAKVMDFGLAKVAAQKSLIESEAETQSLLTEKGMIIGTVPYMSPEQVNGEVVDGRSDIFSFGAVLYEMVTGAQAFQGRTAMATLAAVIHKEPEPLPPTVPTELAKTIMRCLRKDPAQRYQTMSDLKVALEALRAQSQSRRPPSPFLRERWGWTVWAAIFLIAVFVGLYVWQPWRAGPGEPLQASALTTLPGIERSPSFNPDGTQVAFAWADPKQRNQDIYVQLIGQGSPLRRTTDPREDYNPVWSPDGRWIAFFRSEPPAPTGLRSRELWLIPPLSGTERKLAEIRSQDFFPVAAYLAWSSDSKSLIVTDSPEEGQPNALVVVSLETGAKRQLTSPQPPAIADTSPAVSPDGSSLVFLRRTTWATGELHQLSLGEGLTARGEPIRLTTTDLRADFPVWMPEGKEIIFSAKGGLWRLAVPGGNTPIRIPYVGEDGVTPAISRSQPGRPARLVYVRSSADTNIWRIQTSAPGTPSSSPPTMAISSTKHEYHCALSPDGRRVAFTSTRSGDAEIWVSDPDGSNEIQLTSMRAQDTNCAHWSPDGQFIAFSSNGEGEFDVYVVPAAGGKPRRLTSNPAMDLAAGFSRDGKWIYFNSMRSGDYRVFRIPVAGGDEDAAPLTTNQGTQAFEAPDAGSIYYLTSAVESPLWQMPISGGEPVKVLDGVLWFNFWLVGKGAYYIAQFEGETRLQYLNLVTGKSTSVARDLGMVSSGLTASPDGKTILYTRVDSFAEDLMLVENFR